MDLAFTLRRAPSERLLRSELKFLYSLTYSVSISYFSLEVGVSVPHDKAVINKKPRRGAKRTVTPPLEPKTDSLPPGKKPTWEIKRSGQGFHTIRVDSFSAFFDLVSEHFLDGKDFVWRGCRNPEWHLTSTLTRALGGRDLVSSHEWDKDASHMTTDHLRHFLMEIRGIYDFAAEHQQLLTTLEKLLAEKKRTFTSVLAELPAACLPVVFELFATGQHYKLATPLLDWTKSPYIATYFAFEDKDDRKDIGYRAVYALNRALVERHCPPSEALGENSVRFIQSLAVSNSRLVAQAGLFTFSPTHISLEDWVTRNFSENPSAPVLLRFLIRNKMREACIASLNQMNIGFRTLFPEFEGASKFCNYKLEQAKA
jgi:hypothetical protein